MIRNDGRTDICIYRAPMELKNGHQKIKWPPKSKLSIAQSIFQLEDPDFAWYFILTLRKKYKYYYYYLGSLKVLLLLLILLLLGVYYYYNSGSLGVPG